MSDLDLDAIRSRYDALPFAFDLDLSPTAANALILELAASTNDVPKLLAEVERLRAVADITEAATAYVLADPDREDVPQFWEELRGAVEHYLAVQARRAKEAGDG